MSETIDVPITASGSGDVDKIISALDRLHASMEKLGSSSSLARLEQQMEQTRATMITGFAEMASIARKGGTEVVAAAEATSSKLLSLEQRRDVELNRLRGQAMADYVAWWDKKLSIQEQRDTELHSKAQASAARQRQIEEAAAAASFQGFLEIQNKKIKAQEDAATRQRALTEAAAAASFQTFLDIENKKVQAQEAAAARARAATEASAAASFQAFLEIENRKLRAIESAAARQRQIEEASAAASFQNFLDLERKKERAQAEAAARAESAAERQRVLNTGFNTATPTSQLSTVRQAVEYGRQGGNVADRYGSSAAALANAQGIHALEEAHRKLTQTVPGSTKAVTEHGHAMNEAHGLARGLAGSLGGLWLTYGSIVPLLAGAAIASSLKNIVVVGKEVENQLNFVSALSVSVSESGRTMRDSISLGSFMEVTDSSLRSVVESANAMRMLAQNGMNFTQSIAALPSILDLATIGEMKVGQAAIAATGAVSAFGLGMGEVGRVSDIFAKTAASSNTSVIAITESMKQASTVSSLFKVTIEETAGMLGLLAKINITGGAAGTSMTNMLTGLYEPTNKGKKAMEDLGLSTFQTNGQIKPFTQTLEELKMKLAGFNEQARIDFLGSIFTVRGLKAAQLALDNIDQFKQKTEEAHNATGFMRRAVEQLENSSAGAFERLGVTVQNTFVKAFEEASPFVQRIGLDLNHALGSDDTQSAVKNLATNVARLMSTLLDGSSVLAATAAGYVAWRLAASMVGPQLLAASAATVANTTAQAAATVATNTLIAAQAGGAATTEMFAAATTATAVAQRTAAAATVAWSATLMPFLGALAIALAAGAALWLLFRDNTTAADVANLKISNTIDVVREAIERENTALEKSNRLWDAKNGRFRADTDRTGDIEEARRRVTIEENKVKASGGTIEGALRPQYRTTKNDVQVRTSDWNEFSDGLRAARDNLSKLEKLQKTIDNDQAPLTRQRQLRQEIDSTQKALQDYAKQAGQVNSKNELYQPNEAVREGFREAGRKVAELDSLKALVADGKKGLSSEQLNAAQERISQIKTDLIEIKKREGDLLAARPGKEPKADKAAARAAANQELQDKLKTIDVEGQLAKIREKSALDTIGEQSRRGEIGDLEKINAEKEALLATERVLQSVANRKAALVGDKPGKEQGFLNEVSRSKERETSINREAAEKRRTLMYSMGEEERGFRADQLRDEGDLVGAFLSDYESKYRSTIDKVSIEATTTQDVEYAKRLDSYLKYLGDVREAGTNKNLVAQAANQFDASMSSLQEKLADIKNNSGNGLAEQMSAAKEAADAYAQALPKLAVEQQKLQDLVANSKNPLEKKAASDRLRQIKAEAKSAESVWVDMSKVLGNELEKAFGRGGRALGDLMTASLEAGKRQKEIEEKYKGRNSADDQKAKIEETGRAQVAAYGAMAGAAAGFFDEQSRGYQALMAVSRVFHAAELAMTMAELVPKAISAVLGQAQGEPYSAFARMAAMAAIVTGLGVAVSAGRSKPGTPAADVQKQGSGTVYGDIGKKDSTGKVTYTLKSESITRALDLVEENTYQDLQVSNAMLASLRSIESSMSGLGNMVAGVAGLTNGGSFGIKEGVIQRPGNNAALGMGTGGGAALGFAMAGPLGAMLGAVAGTILAKVWGKTTQNIVDSGIQYGGSLSSLQGGQGYNQYASVDTTKSSWFGLSKKTSNSVQTAGLDNNLASQFGLIFTSLEDTLKLAAVGLGGTAGDVENALKDMVLKTTTLSLKDLKGDELTAAIQAVISASMDEISMKAFPELTNFRKVGEGYAETVIRLATDYQTLDIVFQSFGKTFDLVGLGSIEARERLIELSGGLSDFTSQGEYFLKNFFTETEQNNALKERIQPTLSKYGLSTEGGEDAAKKLFKDFILGLNTTTVAGAEAYTSLMKLAPAFNTVVSATDKALEKIADEAKELQSQLDELTLTPAALRSKEREKVDPSNRAIFDAITAENDRRNAITLTNSQLEIQAKIYELTKDKVGAAAVLQKQHNAALLDLDPVLREATQTLWGLEAAATALEKARSTATGLVTGVDDAYTVLETIINKEKALKEEAYQGELKELEKKIDEKKKLDEVAKTNGTKAVNEFKALADAIRSTLEQMSDVSSETQTRARAQSRVREALATARAGGGLPTADALKGDLSVLAKDSTDLFSNMQDYQRDFYRTQGEVKELGTLADSALTLAEQTLKTLEEQKDVLGEQKELLERTYRDEISRLDNTLEMAKSQIEILKGIDTTGLTIVQALEAVRLAIANANQSPVAAAAAPINEAYKTALGRAPDKAGMEYWQNAVASGQTTETVVANITNSMEAQVRGLYKALLGRDADAAGLSYFLNSGSSLSTITANIQESDEYKKLRGFAVGTNYVPYDMPAMIHQGERIIPAGDNRELLRHLSSPPGGNTERLERLVESLTAEVQRLQEIAIEGNKDNKQMVDQFDTVTNNGNAFVMEELK